MSNAAKPTIVFLSNTSWSIYNFRKGLINNLLNSNFAVLILVPKDRYSKKLQDHPTSERNEINLYPMNCHHCPQSVNARVGISVLDGYTGGQGSYMWMSKKHESTCKFVIIYPILVDKQRHFLFAICLNIRVLKQLDYSVMLNLGFECYFTV